MEREYEVEVCRTSKAFETITVTASNIKEAKDKAVEEAGGIVFEEDDANYRVVSVERKEAE